MITFGSKLNRSYSLYLPFNGNFIVITVFFSKSNTSLAFKLNSKPEDDDNDISVNIYKDLKQSLFATTFLDIKDFKSSNLDIRCQFSNILEEFKDRIQYITNESVKLSKITTDNGTFDDLLFMYAFTFTDYQDEFIYLLAERQHIDSVLGKKFVRTSAIQISTRDCMQNLLKIAEHYKGRSVVDFEKNRRYENDDLSNLFPGSKTVNIKRL